MKQRQGNLNRPAKRAVGPATRVLFGTIAWTATLNAAPPDAPRYEKQIAPILLKYCVACHGEREANAELRLDSLRAIRRGSESGKVLVPGRPEKSPLVRLLAADADPHMPPEDSAQPSAAERELLRRWVAAGAPGSDAPPADPLAGLPRLRKAPVRPPATALAYHPKSGLAAVGRYRQVVLYDPTDHRPRAVWNGLPGKVNRLAFSADGKWLFAATGITGVRGELATWNVERRAAGPTLEAHRDIMLSVAVDPTGRYLATTSYDQRTVIWDWPGRRIHLTIEGHHGAVYDAAFDPRGQIVATASGDETVKLWRTSDGVRLDTLSQPQAEQYSVAFSPDGTLVAAGGADNRVRVWRVVSRTEPRINPLVASRFAHQRPLVAVAFSLDGKWLLTGGEDRTIALWRTSDWSERGRITALSDIPVDLAMTRRGTIETATLDGRLHSLKPRFDRDDGEPASVAAAGKPHHDRPFSGAPSARSAVDEKEPNDDRRTATPLPLPGTVRGTLDHDAPGADSDWYRFDAERGSTWIIETRAARDGSPADTLIQIYDAKGRLVPRILLQAIRDSYVTFRGIDSRSFDLRVHNWEEMDLNQFLYLNGEVVKLYLYPRGPDSGFQLYYRRGRRISYFDTTPIAHALHEPCYVVEPVPVGTKPRANGLPQFPIYFENDDGPPEGKGDSRLTFVAPHEGTFYVKVCDARRWQGPDFHYELTARRPAPGFHVVLRMAQPKVNAGSGKEFEVEIERLDGFEGPVRIDVEGFPDSWHVTTPLTVEQGQLVARGTVNTLPTTPPLSDADRSRLRLRATARIDGRKVVKTASGFEKLELGPPPKLLVTLRPSGDSGEDSTARGDGDSAAPFPPIRELVIHPGQTTTARLTVRRLDQFQGRVKFESLKLNLPHGVYVDNIGLNGILIPEGETSRTVFLTAAPWVRESTRWLFLRANQDGTQTTFPMKLHVVHQRKRSMLKR